MRRDSVARRQNENVYGAGMSTRKNHSTGRPRERDKSFSVLARRLLTEADKGLSRTSFYKKILEAVRDDSDCDALEIYATHADKMIYCRFNPGTKKPFHLDLTSIRNHHSDVKADHSSIISDLIEKYRPGKSVDSSPGGSFWTEPGNIAPDTDVTRAAASSKSAENYGSKAVIPFVCDRGDRGVLIMKCRRSGFFDRDKIQYYEEIAQILGIAVTHWRAQISLRERVKELTCMYGTATIAARPDIPLARVLQETVGLLPPGWLYPELAVARITCDDAEYVTPGFRDGLQSLSADIVVDGVKRGAVEVAYRRPVPEQDDGPFLKEEKNLIEAMAHEVALIIERKEAEEAREKLEEQLRHADRLATIGQLAAGVAHELNEPLGSILGFAQLAGKDPEKSDAVAKDLERIVNATLHARTVIERLNLFARQTPQKKSPVSLNRVIEDGLYFLESRCAKAGIDLIRNLAPGLPEIVADRGQLYQVLVNLVVNAIQAMPDGGRLTIETSRSDDTVALTVTDTGTGMDEDVRKKIFVPFFTTKDINEGTGLGLAVVHGIVAAHGGAIVVDSEVGKGSRFEVRLPID